MIQSNSNLTRGYSIALFAAVILSTTAIFIRYLTQTYHIPTLVLAFWRDGFVTLTLLPVLLLLRPNLLRAAHRHVYFLIAYGLVLSIFNAMWTLSVALNGAAISTVLCYSSAGFTTLLGWWFLKERLDWAKLVTVALCLGGCVLISEALDPAAWQSNLLGIFTGTFSGLCYALYTLMGRSASQRGLNPWTTLFYTFAFATLFLAAFNLLPLGLAGAASRPIDFFWLGSERLGWIILFTLAAGPTVLGFGLYNVSLTHLPSSVVNLIVTLEPAFTALTAYFLLGEHLGGIQIVGGLMILAGVVFLRVYEGWLTGRIKTNASHQPQSVPAD